MAGFRHLFSPITIGRMRLENRIVFSAHLTNYAADGLPGPAHAAYYEARAKGGAGLIITEEHSVHPSDWPYEKMIHGFKPEALQGYRTITSAVHRHPAKIIAQINHNGPQGSSMYSRLPLLGPSQVPDPLFREVPKEATASDLAQVVNGYQLVAARAMEGGFDGVELQCSHSSIVRAFLSPASNHRDDAYGGDLRGRSRLMLEIVAAVRDAIGPDPALGVRLSGDEMIEDGTTLEDAVELARMLEAIGGVDYINTSIGVATASLYSIEASMAISPGYALFIPSAIRKAVNLPVVGVGRIKDPLQAEKALAAGHCDLVGMVRAQIADPELASKSRLGRTRDIRLCLSCNQECVGRVGMNRWLGCIENPNAGREYLPPPSRFTRPSSPRVAVIGAGPAGCQAAISLARAGAMVALVEAGDRLGGQLAWAGRVASRAELTDLVRNQRNELASLGIEPEFGRLIRPEDIPLLGADAVVVATGSRDVAPDWATDGGERAMRVISARRLMAEGPRVPPGATAVVYDEVGFHQATSAAELLWEMGVKVHFATPLLVAGQDLGITLDYESFRMRAASHDVKFHTAVIATAAGTRGVSLFNHLDGGLLELEADLLVLSLHAAAEDSLYRAARAGGVPALRIGDALSPRRAHSAVIEGDSAPGLIAGLLKGGSA